MSQQVQISTNQQQLTLNLLQNNLRLDGRGCMKQRDICIQFLSKSGHLLYHHGCTSILIKSSLQLTAPKQQRPSQGFIVFKIDCYCCLNLPQQNKKLSIQLNKLLQKNIIGSSCLDPQSLCIVTGKYVWKLLIQVVVVNDDGNVIDAVMNGVLVGLLDMKKPMVNVEKNQILIKKQKLQMLSIAHLPISMSFYFISNNIFVDPTHLEESVALTRATVTMNVYKEICSIHKPGGMGLDQQTISGVIKILEQKVKQKTQKIRQIVKKRSLEWVN